MSKLHLAVFGGGSVGLCLAAHFASAGADVTLLVRAASLPALQGADLEIDGVLGHHGVPATAITLCDAAKPTPAVLGADMLVMTTKAYQLANALAPFAEGPQCPPVLLLQNGMGAADVARRVLGPDVPVYPTAMMIGMERTAPNTVHIAAQASPILCGTMHGDDLGSLEAMLALSEAGFVPMALDPKIRETIAFKLLFNSCMNPTGALTGQTYGELLQDPVSRARIVALADETLAVYAAAFDYRPADSGAHYVDETLSKIVFPRSGGHRSSMVQDLEAGRKTEIDFLNGAVVRLAEGHGIATPQHQSIIADIKAREAPVA